MSWLMYCRAGFEPECVQEGEALLAARGAAGHARTQRDSGYVVVQCEPGVRAPSWRDPIFARQSLALLAELRDLPPANRLGPVVDALREHGPVADLWVEVPDSDAGSALASLAKGLESAAVSLLKREKLLDAHAKERAHLLLASGTHVLLGLAPAQDDTPWRGGIPRLKLPREAPSRSALKIEEAWLVLMREAEREKWLKPGMTAVDLGAAPGGWTWQLARRSIRVTAVDNGPLAQHVLDTGVVTHVRADGFRFRPRKPVDWLVCDMVEQPSRVAALMADWLASGDARAALFNLKLPMKKRWVEARTCLDGMAGTLATSGRRFALRAKQLYHDREEITVVALPK